MKLTVFSLVLFSACNTWIAKDEEPLLRDEVEPIPTDSDSDTDTDTDTDSDSDGDSDSASDSATDSSTDTGDTATETVDTDTGLDCAGMGWECGEGENNDGVFIDCDAPGCDNGEWCDGHTCALCNTADHCGTGETCATCTGTSTPVCAADASSCVECNINDDCRTGESPFNSPLGLCTPDNTCTCWVSEETGSCNTNADCPTGAGYWCVREYDDGLYSHKICLKQCSTLSGYENGIGCINKVAANVWAPATTCYAFNRVGTACNGNDWDCSVDANDTEADGDINDAVCRNSTCTYSCWDETHVDSLCPTWPEDTDACVNADNTCKLP